MADIYVMIGLATGDDDGTSWANGYQDVAGFQAALDAATAGDTVHVASVNNADITLSAALDCDAASGSHSALIRVIGYDYSGGTPVETGHRVVIDGDSSAANCIDFARQFWCWCNFTFTNATGSNVNGGGSSYLYFLNCGSHSAGANGFYLVGSSYLLLVCCDAYNNSSDGFYHLENSVAKCCTAANNATEGFELYTRSHCRECVAVGNRIGFQVITAGCVIDGCIADGNDNNGVRLNTAIASVLHTRITNNGSYGIDMNGEGAINLWPVYGNNTNGNTDDSDADYTMFRGEDTAITGESGGYRDAANGDYRLVFGAAGVRQAIPMRNIGGDGIVVTRGLPNVPLIRR